ncbi:hypothetical protein TNCV_2446601 [Trichonephila clavipes]|nr:hypothetical protein TNCV_2446601 [Trichonephila clavipes]
MLIVYVDVECNGHASRWFYPGLDPQVLVLHYTAIAIEDRIARISVVARRIRGMPGIFQNVRNFVQRRCQPCQTTSGCNF